MQTDLIRLYENILDAQGIQFRLLSASVNDRDLSFIDYQFREKIYEKFDYAELFQTFLKNMKDASGESPSLFIMDDFELNYCLFEFPDEIGMEYNAKYGLIGPVIFHFATQTMVERVLKGHNFPSAYEKDALEFYNRIPTLPTQDFWVSLLLPLLRPIVGNRQNNQIVNLSERLLSANSNNTPVPIAQELPSFDAIRDRYDAENRMLQAVADGNANLAIELYHKFRQFNMSQRTPDIIRAYKNWRLVLNTILRKAIETSNVHPYYIDALSSEFSIRIENNNNLSELQSIDVTMLRKYAMLVHNQSTKDLSPLIRKCVENIHFYYRENITLESLAKECAVTPNYLSTQFRKETGVTLIHYLHNIRIQQAILLLNTTQYSIQEIAEQCGFADANYFIRIFKKRKGMSPNAYRKNLKN